VQIRPRACQQKGCISPLLLICLLFRISFFLALVVMAYRQVSAVRTHPCMQYTCGSGAHLMLSPSRPSIPQGTTGAQGTQAAGWINTRATPESEWLHHLQLECVFCQHGKKKELFGPQRSRRGPMQIMRCAWQQKGCTSPSATSSGRYQVPLLTWDAARAPWSCTEVPFYFPIPK